MKLSKVCAMACPLLGLPYPPGALAALAACSRHLCGPAFASDPAARARVAGELGVPVSAVHAAAAWESGLDADSVAPGVRSAQGDYS